MGGFSGNAAVSKASLSSSAPQQVFHSNQMRAFPDLNRINSFYSPTLLMNDGVLTGEQVVDAVTRGLRAGEAQYPTVKVWPPNS